MSIFCKIKKPLEKHAKNKVKNMQAERKKRNNKKNKLEEIQKPRGYDRGLILDQIVGATDYKGELMFLIKWYDCDEYDILPSKEVAANSPQDVILFYESRSQIMKTLAQRRRYAEDYQMENLYEAPTGVAITEPATNADGKSGDSVDLTDTVEEPTEVEESLKENETVSDANVTSITDPSLTNSMSIAEPGSTNISMLTDGEIPSAEPLVEPPESTEPMSDSMEVTVPLDDVVNTQ